MATTERMARAVLTDIEGTTTSLSFVKDVLFPYARTHLADFVRAHGSEPAVRIQLNEVGKIAGRPLADDEAIAQLIAWIDEDKKITPLKALQGMIWETGYRRGDFQGHVYDDAARELRLWHEQGVRLYVFSSGSVQAQKLLFGHTAFGDLTPLFSGYFDTTVGNKREAAAYSAIAEKICLAPATILFLSDVREELDAARATGMQTAQILREGVVPAPGHRQALRFDEVVLA